MEKICLDRDALLSFLLGEQKTVDKIKYYVPKEMLCITPLAYFEIMAIVKNQEVANNFLNVFRILNFDEKTARIAANIQRDLHERGYKANMDVLITAAICISNNAYLFTKNRQEYERIKGIKLV